MRAVLKEKAEPGLAVKTVQEPKPGPDEVLIKVKASGICGSDLHMFEWTPGYEWIKDALPVVMGHEFSGQVVGMGGVAFRFKPGDNVVSLPGNPCFICRYCQTGRHEMCEQFRATMLGFRKSGAMAEYIAVPENQLLHLPQAISFDEAALLEPLVTAANAVEAGKPGLGDSVVIFGPGPIGLLVALLSRASGAGKVIVVGSSGDSYRLALALTLGATAVVDASETEPVKAVFDLVGSLGADLVFEAAGSPACISQGLAVLQKKRRLIVLGIHSRPLELDLTAMVRDGKALVGSYSGRPVHWEKMISFLEANRQAAFPLITHRYSIEEAEQAFEVCRSKQSGKVIVTDN